MRYNHKYVMGSVGLILLIGLLSLIVVEDRVEGKQTPPSVSITVIQTPTPSTTLLVDPFVERLQSPVIDPLATVEEAVVVKPKVVRKTAFNEKQKELLQIAYEEGSAIGWPETIQAILLQETTAGLLGPVGDKSRGFGKRSYCHMQIKLDSAKYVLRHFNDMGTFATDEQLLVKLLTDDRFCIRMGARYFSLMVRHTNTWSQAVLAYNRGLTGSRDGKDPVNYLPGIRAKINDIVRPYNEQVTAELEMYASNN